MWGIATSGTTTSPYPSKRPDKDNFGTAILIAGATDTSIRHNKNYLILVKVDKGIRLRLYISKRFYVIVSVLRN